MLLAYMTLDNKFGTPDEFRDEEPSDFLHKLIVEAEYRADHAANNAAEHTVDTTQKEQSKQELPLQTPAQKYTLGYTVKKLTGVTAAIITTAAIFSLFPSLFRTEQDYFAQRDAKLDSLSTVDNATLAENLQSQYAALQNNFNTSYSANKVPSKQQLYELFFAQEALQMVNYPNPTAPETVGPTQESILAQKTIATLPFAMLNATFEQGDSVGVYMYHADTKQLAEYRLLFGEGGKAQIDDKGRYSGHEDRTLYVEKIIHGGMPQETQRKEMNLQANSNRTLYSIVQAMNFK